MQRRYHRLDKSLNDGPVNAEYSRLHTLYPGEPMSSSDNFNRYSVIPEDPELYKKSFMDTRQQTQEYARNLQEVTLAAGGGDDEKITVHPAIDPSSMIEDPELKSATMMSPATADDTVPSIERDPYISKQPAKSREARAQTEQPLNNPKKENFTGVDEQPKNEPPKKSNTEISFWMPLLLLFAFLIAIFFFRARSA